MHSLSFPPCPEHSGVNLWDSASSYLSTCPVGDKWRACMYAVWYAAAPATWTLARNFTRRRRGVRSESGDGANSIRGHPPCLAKDRLDSCRSYALATPSKLPPRCGSGG
eukprot:jgi/Mesen1/1254/ME000129S00345